MVEEMLKVLSRKLFFIFIWIFKDIKTRRRKVREDEKGRYIKYTFFVNKTGIFFFLHV